MQKTRTSFLATMAIAAMAMTAGTTVFANGYIHSANTEKGYVVYPEHFKSDKTRAQVQAEAAELVKNGGSDNFRGNKYPRTDNTEASTKTRQQVIDELMSESPEQRQARLDMTRG